MAALPPLRPLVLVLKVLLKQAAMNEVFTGGISSWSLINMVVAHLQAEGLEADLQWLPENAGDPGALVGVQQAMRFLEDMTHQQEQLEEEEEEVEEKGGKAGSGGSILAQAAGAGRRGSGPGAVAGGGKGWDYGCLLLGFLKRYGQLFDLDTEGVDVIRGGIVHQEQGDRQGGDRRVLWLRDPVEAGERNVAKGSYRINEVREKFDRAVRVLEEAGAVAAAAGAPVQLPGAAVAGVGAGGVDYGREMQSSMRVSGNGEWEEEEGLMAGDFVGDISEEMLEGDEEAEEEDLELWAAVQTDGQDRSVEVGRSDQDSGRQEVEDEGVDEEGEETLAAEFPLLGRVIDVVQGLGYREKHGGLVQLGRGGKVSKAAMRKQKKQAKQQQQPQQQQQGKKKKAGKGVKLEQQQQLQVVGLNGVKLSKKARKKRNAIAAEAAALAAASGGGGQRRGGGRGGVQVGGYNLRERRGGLAAPPLFGSSDLAAAAAAAAVGANGWLHQGTVPAWLNQPQQQQQHQQQVWQQPQQQQFQQQQQQQPLFQQQEQQQQFGQQLGLPQLAVSGFNRGFQSPTQQQQHYQQQQQQYQHQQPQQQQQQQPQQEPFRYAEPDPPFERGNQNYSHQQQQQQGVQGAPWSGMHPARLQQLQQQGERGGGGGGHGGYDQSYGGGGNQQRQYQWPGGPGSGKKKRKQGGGGGGGNPQQQQQQLQKNKKQKNKQQQQPQQQKPQQQKQKERRRGGGRGWGHDD